MTGVLQGKKDRFCYYFHKLNSGRQAIPNQLFYKGFKNGNLERAASDINDPFCRIERGKNK